MKQKQRIEIAGAVYYLQLTGCGQADLFSEPRECLHLRQLLGQLCETAMCRVLGYCLLPDSIHLVIQTANYQATNNSNTNSSGTDYPATDHGHMNSVQVGQWLMGQYASYYNALHGRSGSVFHAHFPSLLIEPNRYLLPVIYKLHRLPIEQGMVAQPAAYPWSSHRDYISTEPPWWLDRKTTFRRIANHHAMQMRRYELLMDESSMEDVDWITGNHPHYQALASELYVDKLLSGNPARQTLPPIDLAALTDWVCVEYGLSSNDLKLWRQHRLAHEVRSMVAALANRLGCASLAKMAKFFAIDAELLETGVRSIEAHRDQYVYQLYLKIEKELNAELNRYYAEKNAPQNTDVDGMDTGYAVTDENAVALNDAAVSADFQYLEALDNFDTTSNFETAQNF